MPTPSPLDTPEDERSLERYLIVGLVLMILLVVAFPFYRATEPQRRARAFEEMERQNVDLGRQAYALHCAACHGEAGRGGRGMPTLAAKEFLGDVSDAQLRWLVAGGIPGTTMSAYDLDLGGPFTAQEIDRVVAYLRSLEAEATSVPDWWAGASAPVVAARSIDEAVAAGHPAAAERAQSGGDAFAAETAATARANYQTYCPACHGAAGEGTPIAPAVRPPRPPLDEDFDALVASIGRGRPGTAMAGFDRAVGGPLEADAILELARWLLAVEAGSED